jgi:hypothetical protein
MIAYPQAQAQDTFSEVLEDVIKLSGQEGFFLILAL